MEARNFSAFFRVIALVIIVSVLGGMGIAHASEDVYSLRSDTSYYDRGTRSTTNLPYYDNRYPASYQYYSATDPVQDQDYYHTINLSLANGFSALWSKIDTSSTTINGSINSQLNSFYSLVQSLLGSTSPVVLAVNQVEHSLWNNNPNAQYQIYYCDSTGVHNVTASSIADILGYENLNSLYINYNTQRIYDQLYQVRGDLAGFYYSFNNSFLPRFWDASLPYSGISVFSGNSGTQNYTAPAYMRVNDGQFSLTTASVDSLSDYLDIITRDLTLQSNMLFTFNKSYTQSAFDIDSASSSSVTVRSVMDSLTQGFSALGEGLGRLAYIFASDDDIAARQEADPQIQQAQDDFISSDSSASLSLGDMGSAKSVSSDLQDTFANGVSVSSGLSYITSANSSIFDFWSDTTVADLYNYGNSQRRSSDITEQVVDFYSDNLASLGVAFDG